jgi:Protein of unknown function (DUF3060)
MDQDDPEKRIAELERELAEQKRIAELERQLAAAKAAAARHDHVGEQPPAFSEAQPGVAPDAQALLDALRTGEPSDPQTAQLREALARTAAAAGMTQAQLDDALQHAQVTVKTGHSVIYPGQVPPLDFGFLGGQPAFTGQAPGLAGGAGFRSQRRRGRLLGVNRVGTLVGVIGGAFGLCVGGAAALTAVFPSSALWTSRIVCGGPNQLTYNTSHYSYKPGQSGTSISFQCVGAAGTYDAGFFAITALQCLLVAFVLCAAVAVFALIRRLLRRPIRTGNVIAAAVVGLLTAAAVVAIAWRLSTFSGQPTQMASGGTMTVKGNGETKTIACNDGHLTVDGRAETVTVTGHCSTLTVDGVINHVTVDAVDTINADGVNNVVIFHSGSPQITDKGLKNTIHQG